MDLGLKDRSALITGGSGGIGLATAHAFAAEGCALHLAARTPEKLRAARDDIWRDFDVPVTAHAVDLGRTENALRLATAGHDWLWLATAGRNLRRRRGPRQQRGRRTGLPGVGIEEMGDDRWRAAWDLKVFGYVSMMRALSPR